MYEVSVMMLRMLVCSGRALGVYSETPCRDDDNDESRSVDKATLETKMRSFRCYLHGSIANSR